MLIQVKCDGCEKQFEILRRKYNERLKRNKQFKQVFCSVKCAAKSRGRRSTVTIQCIYCNKDFELKKHKIVKNERRGSKGNFCSRKCFIEFFRVQKTVNNKPVEIKCDGCNKITVISLGAYKERRRNKVKLWYCTKSCYEKNMTVSEETKQKISKSQQGVPIKSRGRINHIVTEETKEKIRQKRLKQIEDMNIKKYSFHLVHECMKDLGEERYIITNGIVPDAIYFENNKFIAVESERGSWVSCVSKKMEAYDIKPHNYDEVHIYWFDAKNKDKLSGHWHKQNGEWKFV